MIVGEMDLQSGGMVYIHKGDYVLIKDACGNEWRLHDAGNGLELMLSQPADRRHAALAVLPRVSNVVRVAPMEDEYK